MSLRIPRDDGPIVGVKQGLLDVSRSLKAPWRGTERRGLSRQSPKARWALRLRTYEALQMYPERSSDNRPVSGKAIGTRAPT